MLTCGEIRHCSEILANSDSVFEATRDIEEYIGRSLTNDERKLITTFASLGEDTTDFQLALNLKNQLNTPALKIPESDTAAEKESPNVAAMSRLTDQIVDTYRRKNADYGDAFGKSVRKYGYIAALTRMGDKFNRLENFILAGVNTGNVKDESLRDTLLDLATYALMTIISLDEGDNGHNSN